MSFHLLQLSEQDKLALVGKPTFQVLGSLVVATVFWGLQEMGEIGCQCPWLSGYNEVYGISFLLVPAAVLTLLSVFLHRECLMCCRGGVLAKGAGAPSPGASRRRAASWQLTAFLKVFYHSWVWIIVVLLDGDCYACMQYFLRLPASRGVAGKALTLGSWEPPNENSELIRILKFESRLIGLGLLLLLVAIAVCISCCHVSRRCGKPYYWWEYQQMYLEETKRIVLSGLKESASRRAERIYKNETHALAGGAEEAWEHISSAGFARIEYPDDFRVPPDENGQNPLGDRLMEGEEQRDARQEPDLNIWLGESAGNAENARGPNDQEARSGQEEGRGKLGWKIKLQGPYSRITKHLRRAVERALKKYEGSKGTQRESHSQA